MGDRSVVVLSSIKSKKLKVNLVPDAKAAENHCIMPHALHIIDNRCLEEAVQ